MKRNCKSSRRKTSSRFIKRLTASFLAVTLLAGATTFTFEDFNLSASEIYEKNLEEIIVEPELPLYVDESNGYEYTHSELPELLAPIEPTIGITPTGGSIVAASGSSLTSLVINIDLATGKPYIVGLISGIDFEDPQYVGYIDNWGFPYDDADWIIRLFNPLADPPFDPGDFSTLPQIAQLPAGFTYQLMNIIPDQLLIFLFPITHAVIFNPNNGTPQITTPVREGQLITDIPAPERGGYVLLGWEMGSSGGPLLQPQDIPAAVGGVVSAMEFTAIWGHSIRFDLAGGRWHDVSGPFVGNIHSGDPVGSIAGGVPESTNLTGPSDREFLGWRIQGSDDILDLDTVIAMIVSENTVFVAVWYEEDLNDDDEDEPGNNNNTGSPDTGAGSGDSDGVYYEDIPRNNVRRPSAPVVEGDNGYVIYMPTQDPDHIWPPMPAPPMQSAANTMGNVHYSYLIGFGDDTIRPNESITRAQVATIFFRLMQDGDREHYWVQINEFSDVSLEQWFNNAISTTANAGVFLGMLDGTFMPNQQITRAEFSATVVRFMGTNAVNGEALFNDIAGHWAEGYINTVAEQGWVTGFEGIGGAFLPDQPITRAETAAIINRMLDRLPEVSEDLLKYDMVLWTDNMDESTWYYLHIQEATNSHYFVIKSDGIHEVWVEIYAPERPWALLELPTSSPQDIFR